MADFLTKAQRSARMAAIRSRGNKSTELALAQLLRKNGIKGWRRNVKLLGSPDFVFPKQRLAIFVDGCFWHGCKRHSATPATRSAFWSKKIDTNRSRDRRVTRTLRKEGWHVIRIWEHELKKPARCLARVVRLLPPR